MEGIETAEPTPSATPSVSQSNSMADLTAVAQPDEAQTKEVRSD